ncbi:hypothetical protein [Halorubellus litoreus]|uniref:Uncharacterized protein n=1 Tax=Halorubellus litoreus TaxID=755308 RepID=A0ABD5VP42_9EURY
MTENLKKRRNRLPEEAVEELDSSLETKRSELKRELKEEYLDKISNIISEDREETDDFNVVISAFQDREDIDYSFIRTEPLFHQKENNLDILIASEDSEVLVFVECERRLTTHLEKKLKNYQEKKEVIEQNLPDDLDVASYLERMVGWEASEMDFVMSSRQLPEYKIQQKVEELGINLIGWSLATHGSDCMIYHQMFKHEKTAPFNGHSDDQLSRYISNTLQSGVEYQEYVDFTYSSSSILKIQDMILTLVNRHHRQGNDVFNYSDWKSLFKMELSNYLPEERKTLYLSFLDRAIDYNLISREENSGDRLSDGHRAIFKAHKNQKKLINEIREKMAETELQDDLQSRLEEYESQKLTQLEREYATGGTTLSDFVEEDSESDSS